VEKVLQFSGFKLEKTLVEIMNPRDEGLFAWFTVNFLLDVFDNDWSDSFVSLDLGGGSTQVRGQCYAHYFWRYSTIFYKNSSFLKPMLLTIV
jgi:hypothetical protein